MVALLVLTLMVFLGGFSGTSMFHDGDDVNRGCIVVVAVFVLFSLIRKRINQLD